MTKCFKRRMRPAKHARQAHTRPPKVCSVVAGATIVPRANIRWKKATRNRRNVKLVLSDSFKICLETPRAANAQLDLVTTPKVQQRAMRCHLVPTVGMAHFEHVKKDIFVKVKPPMKPLAHPDSTPPTMDPLLALNAHLARMPTLLVPAFVKLVILIPTNPTPKL